MVDDGAGGGSPAPMVVDKSPAAAEKSKSAASQRKKRQNQKRQGGGDARETPRQLSVQLVTLRMRACKLLHLAQLFVESCGDLKYAEESFIYIVTNPDRIAEDFKNQPLLSRQQVADICNSPPIPEADSTKLEKMKLEEIQWEDSGLVIRWIQARGLDGTFRSLQNLQKSIQRVESKINASTRKSQPQQQQQGGGRVQNNPPKQGDQGRRTPTPNRRRGKDKCQEPALDSSQAYAWSSFQNSPDPKDLPIPRFLLGGQTPQQPGSRAEALASSDAARVSTASSGNKFGVRAPPPLPASVKSLALEAEAAEKLSKQQKPRKGKQGDNDKNAIGKNNGEKIKGVAGGSTEGNVSTNSKAGATHAIAPSPIRGYGRGNKMLTPQQQEQQKQRQKQAKQKAQSTADSINEDATNALRQMIGLAPPSTANVQ